VGHEPLHSDFNYEANASVYGSGVRMPASVQIKHVLSSDRRPSGSLACPPVGSAGSLCEDSMSVSHTMAGIRGARGWHFLAITTPILSSWLEFPSIKNHQTINQPNFRPPKTIKQ